MPLRGLLIRAFSRLRRPYFLSLANSPPKARKCPTLCSRLWRSYVLQTTHGLTSIMRRGTRLYRFSCRLGWRGGPYPSTICNSSLPDPQLETPVSVAMPVGFDLLTLNVSQN